MSWSPYILLLANTIPEDTTITQFSFRTSDHMLELVGSSPSREAFLKLQDTLESLPQIETVTIPLSDLTKQNKIDFSLSIPFSF